MTRTIVDPLRVMVWLLAGVLLLVLAACTASAPPPNETANLSSLAEDGPGVEGKEPPAATEPFAAADSQTSGVPVLAEAVAPSARPDGGAESLVTMPAAAAVLVPTSTPPSTATTVPTVAPSIVPSATLTPTTAPTTTPRPSPTTEPGRYCPEEPPVKPEYSRFYLSGDKWPTPDPAVAQKHFWLSRPLPGAGRLLINKTFPYGWDENGRYLLHNGVDVAEDLGTPLLAVADGTVVVAQADASAWYGWRCDWYGHLVVIELDQRWLDQPVYALYGHVLNIMVEPGERVVRGQPVAEIGVGGAATHPHLHFEVRVGENEFASTRNPMLWLDPGATRGVIAGRLVDPEGRPWQGVLLALASEGDSDEILPAWSYLGDPQDLMNPDEGWAENFVFSDVKPGSYQVITEIQGVEYRAPVAVTAGEVSLVEIVTEPYKTPVPEPPLESTPAPAATP